MSKNTTPNTVLQTMPEVRGVTIRIERWTAENSRGERSGLVIALHDSAKLALGKDSLLMSFGSLKAKVLLTVGVQALIGAFKALAEEEAVAAFAKATTDGQTRAARIAELTAKIAANEAAIREAA